MSSVRSVQPCRCLRQRCRPGFTLIEAMLTLVIVSILAGMASPVLSDWADSARAKSVRQQLISTLARARHSALIEARVVTVCKLEGASCVGDIGFPLTAFADPDRDAELDNDEQMIVQIHAEIPDHIELDWNRANGYLRFWPNGGTGALTGSVRYCDGRNEDNDYRVVVARTGRIRIDTVDTRCN